MLLDDLTAAVPSVLELNLTVPVRPLATTMWLRPLQVSLDKLVPVTPLTPVTPVAAGGAVAFYAPRPGGFVDLAAEIRYAHNLGGQVVVDGHLQSSVTPIAPCGVTGLAEHPQHPFTP